MDRIDHYDSEVTIGVVGKYVGLPDAYKSLREALVHGGIANRAKVNIQWLDAELFEHPDAEIAAELEPLHGILVPGGFGERGSEGKIASVKFAREREIPFFGICLGMQMACIEGARNLAGIAEASTTEFGETSEPVVGMITEWMSEEGLQKRAAGGDLGGTMRLGAYPAKLDGNSVVRSIYGTDEISERHRHRYEVNVHYRDALEERRPDLLRHVARRPAARDRRAARPSVVHRRPVPPRAEKPPVRAASVVRRLHRAPRWSSRGSSDGRQLTEPPWRALVTRAYLHEKRGVPCF